MAGEGRHERRSGRRASKRFLLLLLLLLLLAGALFSVAVTTISFAAPGPPIPEITLKPSNPSRTRAASFTYTDVFPIARFECSLDAARFTECGTTRPSTQTYHDLEEGSHTFRVRAVSDKGTSSTASYAWAIDVTRPAVRSIERVDASPTDANAVHWRVTFSEPVQGVDISDLHLVVEALGGSPSVEKLSGSGAAYTVTASTGSGSGTLGLDVVNDGSIADAAGNELAGQATGGVYTMDRRPSPAPGHGGSGDTPVPGQGGHAAGGSGDGDGTDTPPSPGGEGGEPQSLDAPSITGDVPRSSLLYPGGAARMIPLRIHNPNDVTLHITGLTVSLDTRSLPTGCKAGWFRIAQSNVSGSRALAVPARATVTLPGGGVSAPSILMTESGSNQDACANATLRLLYTGKTRP